MEHNSVTSRLHLIGVGGLGSAIVEQMASDPLSGVRYLCIDTEERAGDSGAVRRLFLPGLPGGSGRAPKAAYAAAQNAGEQLAAVLAANEFAVIIGSTGGGTGAGVSPVVAKFARHAGGLAVIVAVEPLDFEGSRRSTASSEAIHFAQGFADAVIRVPNRDLGDICGLRSAVAEVFEQVNRQVVCGVQTLLCIAAGQAQMSLDLGVLRRTLASSGPAVIGYGEAIGEGALREALQAALNGSFLYPDELRRVQHVLFCVQGGEALPMSELRAGAHGLAEHIGEAELLVGLGPALDQEGAVAVTVVGCGLQEVAVPQSTEHTETAPTVAPEKLFDGENLEIPAFIRRQRRRFGS